MDEFLIIYKLEFPFQVVIVVVIFSASSELENFAEKYLLIAIILHRRYIC
jgi:hypothetical protein